MTTDNSDTKRLGEQRVQTVIGTTVYETQKRVYNPVTEEYERIDQLSNDGYKRRFLAVRSSLQSPDVINLDNSPVTSFDKDIWELEERDGSYLLIKKEKSEQFDSESE